MKDETKNEGPRGFAVLLQQIDDGSLHAEISEVLQKLAGELSEHAIKFGRNAKGTLTLTLGLAASPNGTVTVAGEVKKKAPAEPRVPSVFWLTKGNNLSPDNPRQQRLPLREVAAPVVAPRDLDESRSARTV